MLSYYSANSLDGSASASPQGSMTTMEPGMQLTREDIRACKAQALARVRVPAPVIQMITDLRTYLQEKLEPPVYISDRRLVKAIQLMQVGPGGAGRGALGHGRRGAGGTRSTRAQHAARPPHTLARARVHARRSPRTATAGTA